MARSFFLMFALSLLQIGMVACSDRGDNLITENENVISYYDSTKIVKVSVYKYENSCVLQDIDASIDSIKNVITIESPYISDASKLVLRFETSGGGIKTPKGRVSNQKSIELDLSNTIEVISEGKKETHYKLECYYSGLPILEVNTPDNRDITSKEEWINDACIKLINSDGTIDYEGTSGIKGRGNATWLAHPKKGYSLKLDKKGSLLGMPADKKWALLNSFVDRTFVKIPTGFEIARLTNLIWTPNVRPVELILNGKHKGCYYLAEKIKISENRVNIDKENGNILEIDGHFDEEYKFWSDYRKLPYMFKDPDEISPEKLEYIQTLINTLEECIYTDCRFENEDFLNYLDIDSFVDWWIASELTQNQEPNGPASVFAYTNNDNKLRMGPLWDLDSSTFNSHYRLDTLAIRNALYYDKLFDSPTFVNKLKGRWSELMPVYLTHIPQFIDSVVAYTHHSASLDIRLWPYSWYFDYSGYDLSTHRNNLSWFDCYKDYDDAIITIKNTFLKKINNLNAFIKSL